MLEAERHDKVVDMLFRIGMASGDEYDKKSIFRDFLEEDVVDGGSVPSTDDSDVDFDYSQVEWGGVPSEDEMAILERMLRDTSVTVGAAPDAPVNELAPPKEIPFGEVEQDREWT